MVGIYSPEQKYKDWGFCVEAVFLLCLWMKLESEKLDIANVPVHLSVVQLQLYIFVPNQDPLKVDWFDL